MPGSIKIDDGSGNYTILTSPTSLGSDKTFTLASPVLQVVEGTDSSAANITDTSYQATGLSASITPSSTSNKVLVIVCHHIQVYAPGDIPYGYIQLLRDTTAIVDGVPIGAKFDAHEGDSNAYKANPATIIKLDSPSSTSSITYSTKGKYAGSGSGYVTTAQNNATETITLIEVGG